MLTAGDIYAAGTDKPETFDVIRYTGSADYSLAVANSRKEPSPNKNIDVNAITDPYLKAVVDLQNSADVFRFDASDLMPGAVGAGTLWTEITAWVVGGDTRDLRRQRGSELASRLTLRDFNLSSRLMKGVGVLTPAPFFVSTFYD